MKTRLFIGLALFGLLFGLLSACSRIWNPVELLSQIEEPQKYTIRNMAWSPDGKKLAFTVYNMPQTPEGPEFFDSQAGDYQHYLINPDGESLKRIPLTDPQKSERLFWVSPERFVLNNGITYQLNYLGQPQFISDSGYKTHVLSHMCSLTPSQDLLIQGRVNNPQGRTAEFFTPGLFIKKESEYQQILPLQFQTTTDFEAPNTLSGTAMACSPFSNRIYLEFGTDPYLSKIRHHLLAEIDIEKKQVLNPTRFYSIDPPSDPKTLTDMLHFLGWKDENRIYYAVQKSAPESEKKVIVYDYDLTTHTSTEIKNISPPILSAIQNQAAFAFSPDLTQVAFVEKKTQKLMLSDLQGKTSKVLLDIPIALAEQNQDLNRLKF